MTNTFKIAAFAAPLALVAGMASAGGLAAPVETVAPTPMPAPAPMVMGTDWSGLYLGAQAGYGELTGAGDDVDGAIYGVHAGYMYDLGSVVLGAEVDYDLSNIDNILGNTDLDDVTRVKARVGYDAGSFLPYVTGGVARANTGGPDLELDGDFYGAGVAYKFSDNILIGGEVLQHKFYEGDAATSPVLSNTTVRATTATARVSFQF